MRVKAVCGPSKKFRGQSVPELMTIKSGSGRRGKTAHIEKQKSFFRRRFLFRRYG